MGATAQTFIPELAEALSQDWYPYLTKEQIHNDKKLRDSIRDRIFEDWSYESVFKRAEDNIWSDATIQVFMPEWLKSPAIQASATEKLKSERGKII